MTNEDSATAASQSPQPLTRSEVQTRVGHVVSRLGPLALVEEPLGIRTTYRVGGAARVLVIAHNDDDVVAAGSAANEAGLPILAVGNGSNLLVADAGFDGVVIMLGDEFSQISQPSTADQPPDSSGVDSSGVATPGQHSPRLVAGAGVALPVLARRSVALGLSGLEWMVGVPGTVGGGVRMNAGGHGADMASALGSVTIADLASGRVVDRSISDLGLRFRGSALSSTDVVLRASFRASVGSWVRSATGSPVSDSPVSDSPVSDSPVSDSPVSDSPVSGSPVSLGPTLVGEALLSEIVRWRRQNQPGGQNAGSVFVNPRDGAESAGRLVEEAGLKGLRHKTAQVSTKHANFIQADQNGSADDVLDLMRIISDKVYDRFGVRLRSEVRLVGFNTTEFQTEHSEDRR